MTSVVTLIEPTMQASVNAAMDESFSSVHVSSIAEAVLAVRERSAQAIVLSPTSNTSDEIDTCGQKCSILLKTRALAYTNTHNNNHSK